MVVCLSDTFSPCYADDKRYSPETIEHIVEATESHLDEDDGSFSTELMHGNEDEDAIDPDEDKAERNRRTSMAGGGWIRPRRAQRTPEVDGNSRRKRI